MCGPSFFSFFGPSASFPPSLLFLRIIHNWERRNVMAGIGVEIRVQRITQQVQMAQAVHEERERNQVGRRKLDCSGYSLPVVRCLCKLSLQRLPPRIPRRDKPSTRWLWTGPRPCLVPNATNLKLGTQNRSLSAQMVAKSKVGTLLQWN